MVVPDFGTAIWVSRKEILMKPHVVIIMADQLRADVLGKGFTPRIDAIAEEGISFENAYTACPLCVPARGAFFTGTYPNHNGSLINPWEPADAIYGDVKKEYEPLYELMEEDWDSIHSGKQHLFTEGGKLEDREDSKTTWCCTEKIYKQFLAAEGVKMPGGPRFRMRIPEMVNGKVTRVSSYSNANTGCYEPGEKYYFDRYFAEKAVEGLKNRNKEKPLLLNAMFLAPHPPLQIPEPWYGMVTDDQFELPENVGVFYKRQSPLQMYNLTGIVGARYDKEHWKEAWRVYLGLVSMLDECVGQIIDELKEQGIYDDSLIIFTSDHGEMLGSHGLFQKMCMYEESARVPLYIKLPKKGMSGKMAAGTVVDQVVSHVDVMPTLCDYLGIRPKHQMDGRSLFPLLRGERMEKKAAYIQYDGNGSRSNFQRCVVNGKYKLIVDLFQNEAFYELYDLEKDSQETTNLLFDAAYDSVASDLMGLLAAHMMKNGDMLTLPVYAADRFRSMYGPFEAP